MSGTGKGVGELVAPARAGPRLSLRRRAVTGLRRFWRVMMDANVTGPSAMVAYNMLLGVVPVALLALFVAGQILSSHSVQESRPDRPARIFPGATAHTLIRCSPDSRARPPAPACSRCLRASGWPPRSGERSTLRLLASTVAIRALAGAEAIWLGWWGSCCCSWCHSRRANGSGILKAGAAALPFGLSTSTRSFTCSRWSPA